MSDSSPEHTPIDIDAEIARSFDRIAQLHALKAGGAVAVSGATQAETQQPDAVEQSPKKLSKKEIAKLVADQYIDLKSKWSRYGIEVPPKAELKGRLTNAIQLIKELEAISPMLNPSRADIKQAEKENKPAVKLGVLLIPPTAEIGWPIRPEFRAMQGLIAKRLIRGPKALADEFDEFIDPPDPSDNWRVLVTDVSKKGIYLGTPAGVYSTDTQAEALADSVKIAGLIKNSGGDQLGLFEYAALTLQSDGLIDENTRTWLVKDYEADEEGTLNAGLSVSEKGRFYSFTTTGKDYHTNLFRPAFEIGDKAPSIAV